MQLRFNSDAPETQSRCNLDAIWMQYRCDIKQLKCNLDTTLMQSRYNLDATQMQCRSNLRKTKLNFDVSLAQFQPQLVFYFFSKSRFHHTYISLGNQYGFDLWWIWIWYVLDTVSMKYICMIKSGFGEKAENKQISSLWYNRMCNWYGFDL